MEICDKKLLRREGMARRRGLTAGQRQEKSAAIAERLIHAELFRQAESVFCYISMENEVHTEAVLEAALAAGKAVSIPYVLDKAKGLMCAAQLQDMADLVTGEYNIPTLPPEKVVPVEPAAIDQLCFIQLLCWNEVPHICRHHCFVIDR